MDRIQAEPGHHPRHGRCDTAGMVGDLSNDDLAVHRFDDEVQS